MIPPPHPVSGRIGAVLRGVLAAAAAMLVFARFLPGVPRLPGATVDDGWGWAMNVATAHHLVFGRDIVFTYGPYAAVVSRYYDPALRGLIILGAAIPAAAFAAGLIALAEPAPLALAVLALPLVTSVDALAFLLPLPAILLCARALRGGRVAGVAVVSVLLAVALGFLPLAKFSVLPVCVIGDGLVVVLLWALGRRRLAAAVPVVSLLALVALWGVAGQPVAALAEYFAGGMQMIAGYGDAMARYGPAAHVMRAVYASVVLLALVGWEVRGLPRRVAAATVLGVAVLLWVVVKAGYVREDVGHEDISLSALGGMFLVVAAAQEERVFFFEKKNQKTFIPWRTPPASLRPFAKVFCFFFSKKKTFLSFFFAFVLLVWPSEQPFTPSLTLTALTGTLAGIAGGARLIFHPGALARDFATAKAALPALPWHPPGTADIYETGQSALFASDLAWSPRPVIQSYAAYTQDLIRRDVAHVVGPAAPENIFFRPEPIDQRLPALDDGASWPALLSRYVPAGYDAAADLAWLRRDPAAAVAVPGAPIVTARPVLGEAVALPAADAVWARIDVRPSVAGRAAGLALKMPPLWLTLTVPGMAPYRFRLISAMAREGFLMSPLVLTVGDFLRLRPLPGGAPRAGRRPVSFTVTAADWQGWAYRDRYAVSLAPIAFAPAAPVAAAAEVAPLLAAALPPARPWICFLDTVDGAKVPAAPISPGWPIRVRGWTVFDLPKGLPADRAALGFLGEDGRLWAAPAQMLPSWGIAAYFHQPAFDHAYVRADVDVSGLPAGEYAVRVLAFRGGEGVSCPTALRVRVERKLFFFEKKNQKTFIPLRTPPASLRP